MHKSFVSIFPSVPFAFFSLNDKEEKRKERDEKRARREKREKMRAKEKEENIKWVFIGCQLLIGEFIDWISSSTSSSFSLSFFSLWSNRFHFYFFYPISDKNRNVCMWYDELINSLTWKWKWRKKKRRKNAHCLHDENDVSSRVFSDSFIRSLVPPSCALEH